MTLQITSFKKQSFTNLNIKRKGGGGWVDGESGKYLKTKSKKKYLSCFSIHFSSLVLNFSTFNLK